MTMNNIATKLSLKEKIGYSLGDTASHFVWDMVGFWLLFFYTDVYGISAAAAGTIMLVARFWDMAIDPVIGIVSDRTNTRWGKFRPYILYGAIPYAVLAILTFTTPHLGEVGKIIYAGATYVLLMTAYAAINLPYSALGAVMTAESCTGGFIGHLLSKHAGSSQFYTGGIISYDNRIKTEFLDVPTSILQTVGAVSKEAVEQMAQAVREKMNTDYAISVSGIMGPTGKTDEKPLGMVWVGVANKEKVVSKVFYLRFERQRNIEITATQAINLLRLLIINKI
jgi:PncC family amidohydrolase